MLISKRYSRLKFKLMIFVRKIWMVSLSTLIVFCSVAQTKKLTLKECVEIAVKNNLDVQKSDLSAQTAQAYLTQAKAAMLPSLNGSISHGAQQGRNLDPYSNTYINANVSYGNYGLTTNLTLFNGLSIQNGIKQYRAAFQAANMEEQQQKDNLTLNVILAYLQVLTNEDLLDLAYKQVDVTQKQVDRLKVLEREGFTATSGPKDLSDLKGQLATAQLNVVNTSNSLETARLTLAQLLYIDYSKDLDVERLALDQVNFDYDSSVSNIYKTAEKNLALIKAVDLRSKSASYALKSAKGLQYPSLSFGAGIYTNYSNAATTQQLISTSDQKGNSYVNYNGDKLYVYAPTSVYQSHSISYGDQFKNNKNTSFGLTLNIPLLNGFQTRTRINVARIQLKQAELTAKATRVILQQNVEQAYVYMTTAENSYKAQNDQVDAYKESFRIAELKFNAGAVNSDYYVLAKNNLDQANINLIVARYNYVLRTKILDYYQGRPLW